MHVYDVQSTIFFGSGYSEEKAKCGTDEILSYIITLLYCYTLSLNVVFCSTEVSHKFGLAKKPSRLVVVQFCGTQTKMPGNQK